MYKKAEASLLDSRGDRPLPRHEGWEQKLNDKERHFISTVLAFFAASDAA